LSYEYLAKVYNQLLYNEGYLYEKMSPDMEHYYCVVVKAGQSYDVSKDGQVLGKIHK